MARMEDILAVLEQSISERLLTNFLKSAAYMMIDLKRILDRTETAEPKYMLWGKKWVCGQNNLENIGIYKSNKFL